MCSLASFYEREAGIAEAVRSAVTYPMVMLVMMLIVVAVLVARVFRISSGLLPARLGDEPGFPEPDTVGSFLNRYGLVFVIILLALIALVLYLTRTERPGGACASGRTFSVFPAFFGSDGFLQVRRRTVSSAFQRLFPGGKHLYGVELTEGERFREKLNICREKLDAGEDMSEAFTHAGIFTGVYGRMMLVAQKTGTLDEALQDIASRCEDELDDRLARAMSVLEPTLVAVLSIVTGVILLSVMLPLMGILSGM